MTGGNDDDKLIIQNEPDEPIDIWLDPLRHPTAYKKKICCLMSSGLTKEQAKEAINASPLELELFYIIGEGLFAIEAEAINHTPIYNPYTGKEIPLEN